MDNIEVRRAMTVILLSTDPNDSLMLHSVRVIEKFVSDALATNVLDATMRNKLDKLTAAAPSDAVKKLGISPRKLVVAEKFLRTGFKSRTQIANHLGITTDTVKTKVMPNIRRVHNVERKRFGVTGRYKYRIA